MQREDSDSIHNWLTLGKEKLGSISSNDIVLYASTPSIADQFMIISSDQVVNIESRTLSLLVANNWLDMLEYWANKGVAVSSLSSPDILEHCKTTEMLDAIATRIGKNKLKENLLSKDRIHRQYLEKFIQNFADAHPDKYENLISWLNKYDLLTIPKTKFLCVLYAPNEHLATKYLNEWQLDAQNARCLPDQSNPKYPNAHRSLISNAIYHHLSRSQVMFDFWLEKTSSKPEIYASRLSLRELILLKRRNIRFSFTGYGGLQANIEKAMQQSDSQILHDLLVIKDFKDID